MNIRRPGQRPLRKSTGVRVDGGTKQQTEKNRILAQTILAIAEAQYAGAQFGLPTATRAIVAPTLQRFHEDTYEPWLKRERADRWQQPATRIRALFYPLFRDTPLDQLRPAAIERWRARRLATGVTKQSVERELNYLRGLLAKAVEWEQLAASPLETLSIEHAPSPEIIRYLSPDEEDRLMAALEVRDQTWRAARARFNVHRAARQRAALPVDHYKDWLTPAVVVALHTGIRRKELFKLQWSAIDWRAGTLTVTALTSKNKRYARHIPMNDVCRDALEHWQGQTERSRGLVFLSRRGRGLTYVQSSWDTVLEDAAIVDFRWHDLRHTFASKLVQRGVSLLLVSKLLGHRSLKTTMRYAHLAPDQSTMAVALLTKKAITASAH